MGQSRGSGRRGGGVVNYLIAAYTVTILPLVLYGISLLRECNSLSKSQKSNSG